MAKRRPEQRIVIEYDDCPDMSWLEQWDTPEKYKGNEVLDEDGNPMSFEEYMQGPGNKANHVMLCMLVEQKCKACGKWEVVESLSGIDFLEYQNDWTTGTFTPEEAVRLKGYLGECAGELLSEAGGMFPAIRKILDELKQKGA